MNPKYRFFLTIENETRLACPLYGDKVSLVYTLEKDQQLFRTSLDGEFKFLKSDFDFIMSKSFDSIIYIRIERSVDYGNSYSEYFNGKFVRTDCTINETDKILKTSISPIDGYENIISGLDKEFNLIELAPAMQELSIYKRPAVQIYVAGDEVITTFIGGTYFEQSAEIVTDSNDLQQKYFFSRQGYVKEMTVSGVAPYAGKYVCQGLAKYSYLGVLETYVNADNPEYTIKLYKSIQGSYDPASDPADPEAYYWRHARLYNSEGTLLFANGDKYSIDEYGNFMPNTTYNMQAASEETSGYLSFEYTATDIYARLLLDVLNYNDSQTQVIPLEDITVNNSNYKRCVPIDISANISVSTVFSSEPTEWGQYQPGRYYTKPYSLYTKQFYPIGRSTWLLTSLWYTPFMLEELFEYKGRKKYQLKHSYTLAGCIKVLLAKIAPELTFDESPLYSRFFYEAVNPISSDNFRLFIVPISNILKGEYDRPAQKALITLRNIFDMLRDCFRCYWFVDNGRLRIEHVNFFRNGLNYLTLADAGLDVSNIIEPKTEKPWTTAANSYYFDKLNIPEYLQFKWADSVSKPFEGYPIEVISNYVEKGNVEEIGVSKFSSDVDLMLLNPEAFSNDNFAVLAATLVDGTYELPFLDITVDDYVYSLQNGLLAFVDLQPKYYTKDLPARTVKINNVERTFNAKLVKRNKLQDIKFPVGISSLNPMQLIKTKLGEGLADSIKINLSSLVAQVTLRYDNE